MKLTWVLIPFPKTPSDECINQSLVCVYKHSIAQTQKILIFVSLTGECQQQNILSMHLPRRWNVTASVISLWDSKTVTYAKISPKMVNPRDIPGKAEEEELREAFSLRVL